MTCENCKQFDTSEIYPESLGWCELRFPVWFYRIIGTDEHDHDKVVRKDDSCSFFDEAKK